MADQHTYEPGSLEEYMFGLGEAHRDFYLTKPTPAQTRDEVDEWDRLSPEQQAGARKAHLAGYRHASARAA